jgi:glycosyltransferase involved in cell wall biosynthesis
MSTSLVITRSRDLEPTLPRRRSDLLDVEIVIPVHNERFALEGSVRMLHGYLSATFPFSWQITIVDNASTDGTLQIARRLMYELPEVGAMHLPAKGRGRALRTAWSVSRAEVLAYMDVDLSTDLGALLPLVAPLMSGHSDLAIGTRLAPGARVTRRRKRELISRCYNRLLHLALRARFSDAQCGFKAIRAGTAVELLVLAQRRGLRIHEVPVDWVEDADSCVEIAPTAVADLRGVARLLVRRPSEQRRPALPASRRPMLAP